MARNVPEILIPFGGALHCEEPLRDHTTLRIGGPAEFFFTPRCVEDAVDAYAACRQTGMTVRILGGGSNLLVADAGVRGLVIDTTHLKRWDVQGTRLIAEVGVPLEGLVRETAVRGLGGLEGLVGIPGRLGGAIVGNAGGRHGTVGACVRRVEAVDLDGRVSVLQGDALGFRYRQSGLHRYFVVRAELDLSQADPADLRGRMDSIRDTKRMSQPFQGRSAGCIFRNPQNTAAGELIDRAGFKLQVEGGARVSGRHANFILNEGDATCRDVVALIRRIREKVERRFRVRLQPEIRIWPGPEILEDE